MAAEQEIMRVLAEADEVPVSRAQQQVDMAVKEVTSLLTATNESLVLICKAIEVASSREELKDAFKRFNGITRILLEAVPGTDFDQMVLKAGRSLEMSPRLNDFLAGADSLKSGLLSYKTAIIQELAVAIRDREKARHDDAADEELFTHYLGQGSNVVEPVTEEPVPSLKRKISAVADIIPKKSKIPA